MHETLGGDIEVIEDLDDDDDDDEEEPNAPAAADDDDDDDMAEAITQNGSRTAAGPARGSN